MSDQAKRVMTRLYDEVVNRGRWDVLDEIIADHAVDHEPIPGGTGDARTDLRQWLQVLRMGFPDYRAEVLDLISEDDRIVARVRISGTNTGYFLGTPATGRPIDFETVDIARVRDGLIVEHWGVFDTARMLEQLGLIPTG
jgi:steroid delta-isomerase-like uncharacterized protein